MLTFALILFLSLIGVGFAQEVDLSNFQQWFSRPAVFIPAIVVLTDWVRERFTFIDGKFLVGLTSVVIGVGAGLVGDYFDWITVAMFAELDFPWGGVAYGSIGGASAVFGVSLYDFILRRTSSQLTKSKGKVDPNLPEGGTNG